MRKTMILALGIGLLLAGPAQMAFGTGAAAAEEWHGRGGYGGGYGSGYDGWHHDHDGIGAGGVILGLAAVAGVAALASSASHHDGYYDRGYAPSAPAYGYGYGYQSSYGYQGGYGYQGSYGGGGDYTRAAIGACANAAVGQAQGWSGYARFGRVEAVERRGDDTWVRGTVRVGGGGGYDRDYDRGYEGRGYEGREVRFQCKFDDGRVRSVRVERPDYAYNGGY